MIDSMCVLGNQSRLICVEGGERIGKLSCVFILYKLCPGAFAKEIYYPQDSCPFLRHCSVDNKFGVILKLFPRCLVTTTLERL